MKRIYFLLSALIIASVSFAQAPQGINYQGVARNNLGSAISNTVIAVQFTIYQGTITNTKYQEHQTALTDTFGLYSLVIGNGTVTSGTFNSIPWASGNLSIQIDINGSTIATTQLQSVPYALYSGSSSSGITSVTSTGAITTTTNSGTVTVGLGPVGTPTNTYGAINAFPIIQTDADGRVTNATTTQTVVTSVNGTGSPVTVTTFSTGAVTVSTNTIITGATVGSASLIPIITYDNYGRIIGVATSPVSSGAGTVTSVTTAVGTPLSITNPNTTPTISITPAGNNIDGYLTGADWITFNNKISAIIPSTGLTATTISNSVTITATTTAPIWNANQLLSIPINNTVTATNGQVLQYNAGNWAPSTIPALPTPQIGSLLYSNSSNIWMPTNPSNISSDGNSITVVNTNTATTTGAGDFEINNVSNNNPALFATTNGAGDAILGSTSGSGSAIEGFNSGTGNAANFSITNTSNNKDALTVSTNGGGNGIFGVTSGPGSGVKGYTTGAGTAVQGFTNGTGNAANFQITNNANTNTALVATTNGSGIAGNFTINNNSNSNPALSVFTNGIGNALQASVPSGSIANSAIFMGGAGVQVDKIQITGPITPSLGLVLTSDNAGNASWKPASGGLPSGVNGQVLYDSLGTWKGSNINNLFFNGTNMGIGTTTPAALLDITSNGAAAAGLNINMNGTNGNAANFHITNTVSVSNVLDVTTNGTGNAGNFFITPTGTGNVINATTSGTGIAGNFAMSNAANANPALAVATTGTTTTSYSGKFLGGAGLQTDKFTMTNGAIAGGVLTSNGTGNATWQMPTTGVSSATNGLTVTTGSVELGGTLINPTTITQNTNNMIFNATTGNFQISNSGTTNALTVNTNGSGKAVFGQNLGTGGAGIFQISNTLNGSAALNAATTGTGYAGEFQIINASNNFPALHATTNGTGMAGNFVSSNTGGAVSPALVVSTAGTGAGSYSAQFSGGVGIQTDAFTMTNGAIAGGVLTSNGAGNATWQMPSTGVSSVTVTAPITNAGTALAPVIGITTASITTSGALTSGDWNIFNNKVSSVITNSTLTSAGSPTVSLSLNTIGTAGTYGSSTLVPQITVDTYGRVTSVNPQPIPPATVTGASNGLTLIANNITLGGALTGVTTITQNTNNMLFNATTGDVQINTGSSTGALVVSNNGIGQAGNFMISNTANAANALSITTLGGGIAGNFNVNNATNASTALQATTNGTSGAGLFTITNATNTAVALNATTNGTGQAGYFQINNAANIQSALIATTNGTGTALQAINTGTASGNAGYFNITNAANGSPSLYATTTGAGNAGFFNITNAANFQPALYAATNGTGAAVQGFNSGTGSGGNFQVTNAGSASNALFVSTNGTGSAGNFNITNAGNTQPSLFATTNGTGGAGYLTITNAANGNNALYASTVGTGIAGNFTINNAANANSALYATTNGTGDAGYFNIGNATNVQPALIATTNGTGNSGAFSGGAGLKTDGFTASIVTLTANTTLTGTNYYAVVTANVLVTLPLASANLGRVYVLINPGSAYTLLSQAGGGAVVNLVGTNVVGSGSSAVIGLGSSIRIISDGTNWREW